ncbi:MAG: hypothetical protein ACO23C_10050 [Prochlorococcaceae cyanobacterium]|jgi:hypothetical protein
MAVASTLPLAEAWRSAPAAQVGASQSVNFGQALISSSCTLSSSDGSIGVRTNRSLITSDSGETGNFNGNLAAATIAAVSNLTSNGFIRVDNPTLTGGSTQATTSQVRMGTGSWDTSAQVNLDNDGTLATTPLHVRFSTTNDNNRFANGTYSASATVSCYDG